MHVLGVKLQVDNSGDRDNLRTECICFIHVKGEPVNKEPSGSFNFINHVLSKYVQHNLVRNKFSNLHHMEQLLSSLGARHYLVSHHSTRGEVHPARPGSGRTTQCEYLQARHGWVHLSSGTMMRNEVMS